MDMNDKDVLIEVKGLSKHFPITGGLFGRRMGEVKAVNNINFSINAGETLGLVGESGCGKTTLGRCLLRLIEPSAGQILYQGQDVTKLGSTKLREMRKNIQIIFQDPYASLNPRMTIGTILEEPLIIHKLFKTQDEKQKRLYELLDYVQLPKEALKKYPHEFSGGQRQRVAIARALAVRPKFIVCDEPVSALDVSVQAQVINLLMDLQKELNLTYLFIAHDLNVVEFISQRVAVMYLGNIVEMADSKELYTNPKHPYTKALISAIPIPEPNHKHERIILQGDVPSPMSPPKGCHFSPRCWKANEECRQNYPAKQINPTGHEFSCYFPNE